MCYKNFKMLIIIFSFIYRKKLKEIVATLLKTVLDILFSRIKLASFMNSLQN